MGNPLDQNDKVHGVCFFFLAPYKVGLFRISLFMPNGICSNKVQSTWKIKLFLAV